MARGLKPWALLVAILPACAAGRDANLVAAPDQLQASFPGFSVRCSLADLIRSLGPPAFDAPLDGVTAWWLRPGDEGWRAADQARTPPGEPFGVLMVACDLTGDVREWVLLRPPIAAVPIRAGVTSRAQALCSLGIPALSLRGTGSLVYAYLPHHALFGSISSPEILPACYSRHEDPGEPRRLIWSRRPPVGQDPKLLVLSFDEHGIATTNWP